MPWHRGPHRVSVASARGETQQRVSRAASDLKARASLCGASFSPMHAAKAVSSRRSPVASAMGLLYRRCERCKVRINVVTAVQIDAPSPPSSLDELGRRICKAKRGSGSSVNAPTPWSFGPVYSQQREQHLSMHAARCAPGSCQDGQIKPPNSIACGLP